MHAWLRLVAALPLLLVFGCSDPAPPEGDAGTASSTGSIVVGVTSDLRAGVDVKTVHAVMSVDGEVFRDEVLKLGDGNLDFPLELAFDDRPDGALVDVVIDAFGDSTQAALLTRKASTKVVAGKKLLLRTGLDAVCVQHPGAELCAENLTCAGGVCRDPSVSPTVLEEYTADWNEVVADLCKPLDAGDPVVIVGLGQADYLAIDDYETAQIEAGPQGGYHIWIATRMKNLRHSGSITEVTGSVPELDTDLPPFSVIFSFDADEGGYCKLAGLRFRVDDPIDVHTLLGKVVKVNVTITDRDGSVGKGERLVTLSDTIIE